MMTLTKKSLHLIFFLLIILHISNTAYGQEPQEVCEFNPAWMTPQAIPPVLPENATNCDFYQFVTKKYLSVLAWSDEPELFGYMSIYGLFREDSRYRWFPTKWGKRPQALRKVCEEGILLPPLVSELTLQAGQPRPLIDQSGNYTFYDVVVNETMYKFLRECKMDAANRCTGSDATRFPPGAMNIKTAWRIVEPYDEDRFITTDAWVKSPSTGECSVVRAGLVGMHLVIATKDHPEMIWSSWEHKDNAPHCADRQDPHGWSYYSSADPHKPINTYLDSIPASVCNPIPEQGSEAPARDDMNAGLAKATEGTPLENYRMAGALWTLNGADPVFKHLHRGNTKLYGPVLETYYADQLNCFDCHTYSIPTKSLEVSHMNDVIANMQSQLFQDN